MILAAAVLAGVLVYWTPRYWPVSVGIAALAAAALCWAVSADRIEFELRMIPVACIASWGFMQLGLHLSAVPSMTMRASITWLASAIAFFLGSQILRARRNRDLFLKVMLWSVTALAVESLLQIYTLPVRVFGIFPADESVIGTIYYRNQFAALMELAAPIALWQISKGRTVAGGLAFAAMFAATVAGASRAGFILLLAELIVFVVLMIFSGQWALRRMTAIVVTTILLAGFASAIAGTEKLWDKLQEQHPYEFRHELLSSSVAMIKDSPWTGRGLGTWRSVYPKYATLDAALMANEAHNDWAQWAADGGIPFALLIAITAAWIAVPSVRSIWGMGILCVLAHCCVDYPMRAQPIALIWFTLAGSLGNRRPDHPN